MKSPQQVMLREACRQGTRQPCAGRSEPIPCPPVPVPAVGTDTKISQQVLPASPEPPLSSNFHDLGRGQANEVQTQQHRPRHPSAADVPRVATRMCRQQVCLTKYGSRAERLRIPVRDLALTFRGPREKFAPVHSALEDDPAVSISGLFQHVFPKLRGT